MSDRPAGIVGTGVRNYEIMVTSYENLGRLYGVIMYYRFAVQVIMSCI